MFWLRNKKDNFQLGTFILRPGILLECSCIIEFIKQVEEKQ